MMSWWSTITQWNDIIWLSCWITVAPGSMFASLLIISKKGPFEGLKLTVAGIPLYFTVGFVITLLSISSQTFQESVLYHLVLLLLTLISLNVFIGLEWLIIRELINHYFFRQNIFLAIEAKRFTNPWILGILTSWTNPYFIGLLALQLYTWMSTRHTTLSIFVHTTTLQACLLGGISVSLIIAIPLCVTYLVTGAFLYYVYDVKYYGNIIQLAATWISSLFLAIVIMNLLSSCICLISVLV